MAQTRGPYDGHDFSSGIRMDSRFLESVTELRLKHHFDSERYFVAFEPLGTVPLDPCGQFRLVHCFRSRSDTRANDAADQRVALAKDQHLGDIIDLLNDVLYLGRVNLLAANVDEL